MNGWQDHFMPHRQQRQGAFKCSCSAQQMSVHRLCRADGDLVGAFTEYVLDGGGFHRVIGQRAGAMRVNGIDRARRERSAAPMAEDWPRTLGRVMWLASVESQ